MHRCLEIPEILKNIFFLLRYGDREKTLLAAAQACRRFSEPALDVLWSELWGIYPIISCMGLPAERYDTGALAISSAIQPEHLATLKKYASRVRTFRDAPPVINTDSWSLLFNTAGSSILPNVRHIFTAVHDYADYCKLRLVMGPSLKSFTLIARCETPYGLHLASYLANLDSSKYSSLREFSLQGDPLEGFGLSAISRVFQSLPFITALHLRSTPLPITALQFLSQMEHLKQLTVNLGDDPRDPPRSGSTKSHTFSSLEKLTILSEPTAAVTFLNNIHYSHTIKAISISTYTQALDANQWHLLIQAISERLSPDVLEEIEIENDSPLDNTRTGSRVWAYTLRLLARFNKLKSVKLWATQNFELNDELLDELAQAWPSIVTLAFVTNAGVEPQNTLIGLSTLADHCPELTNLTLPFDASDAPLSREDHPRPTQLCKLYTLNVHNSPLTDPYQVAAFLSEIFPNVMYITMHDYDDEELVAKWTQVEECVPLFAAVRLYERNRRSAFFRRL